MVMGGGWMFVGTGFGPRRIIVSDVPVSCTILRVLYSPPGVAWLLGVFAYFWVSR